MVKAKYENQWKNNVKNVTRQNGRSKRERSTRTNRNKMNERNVECVICSFSEHFQVKTNDLNEKRRFSFSFEQKIIEKKNNITFRPSKNKRKLPLL